jgi:hypothetical protein
MLCRKCSSSHTEHNKTRFAIFGFFCDLICILQVAAETQQGVRIILRRNPWNFLSLTKLPLPLAHRTLQKRKRCTGAPAAQGSSPPARDRRSWPSSGTRRWLGVPVLDWGAWFCRRGRQRATRGAGATRPLQREFRRRERFNWSTHGYGSFRASQGSF